MTLYHTEQLPEAIAIKWRPAKEEKREICKNQEERNRDKIGGEKC